MARGIPSSCVNHPSIEAVGRCKQCGKPFCGDCRVAAPTGNFCSTTCREQFEHFVQRAQQLDKMSKSGAYWRKFTHLLKKLAFYAVVLLVATFIATYFGLYIPVLSDIVRWIVTW